MLPAYFYPEKVSSSYLTENRNEAFIESGIEITIYTPMPTRGVDNDLKQLYKYKKNEQYYNGKMVVNRFSMIDEKSGYVIRGIRYFLCWIKQLYFGVLAKDIDLIYLASTPPIQGMLGGILKKIKKVPFVYNLQDIFPDSLVGTEIAKKNSILWKIGRKIENFTYRNADKIIVISEGFKKNIMDKGVSEDKIEVIYNWVDEEAVKEISRDDNLLFDRYNLDRNKFYITYCGNIGMTQNLDMLLDVAKELEYIDNIHFVLIGNGAYKDRVEDVVRERDINNVTLLPFQPYEDISHVFSLGNVGLVISKPGVGENSVPSKTWSILSASRPVLASFDENELKSIIEKNHCGLFTKANDKEALIKSILELYNNPKLCIELGKNGRKFILSCLTKDVGTQKYVNAILKFDK